MLFTTFLFNGIEKIGALREASGMILDLSSIKELAEINSILDLIGAGDSALEVIKYHLENKTDAEFIPVGEVQLLAPIPRPIRDIICLGLNYKDHAEESKSFTKEEKTVIEHPIYFSKMAAYIIGPEGEIKSHREITEELDYEVELAIVIGKEGTNITIEEAEDYIFGYSILNDLTARNLQKRHSQWLKGKSLDTLTAMGPYIAYKGIIPMPVSLSIESAINDEVRQKSNTSKLIFDIPYIISDLSRGVTLKKGDIIATGTPAGVGMGFNPPKYLKSGDKVRCSIEKIGTITNYVK